MVFGLNRNKKKDNTADINDAVMQIASDAATSPQGSINPDIEYVRYLHTYQPEDPVGRMVLSQYAPIINNTHVVLGNFSKHELERLRLEAKAYANFVLLTRDLSYEDLSAYLAADLTADAAISRGVYGTERLALQSQRREVAVQTDSGPGLMRRTKRALQRYLGLNSGGGEEE
jgi:hypothetical protein